jgi:hypothetical protein
MAPTLLAGIGLKFAFKIQNRRPESMDALPCPVNLCASVVKACEIAG